LDRKDLTFVYGSSKSVFQAARSGGSLGSEISGFSPSTSRSCQTGLQQCLQ